MFLFEIVNPELVSINNYNNILLLFRDKYRY